ncbi:hypothetical protein HY636_05910 [Candidatus Woesearchaeota archaeon]|nr:hypothetical protein [Candidatus Woesearchaeota archaeon]
MGFIGNVLKTGLLLYVAAMGIRGCQVVRSSEAEKLTALYESVAYIGKKTMKEHPEYIAELEKAGMKTKQDVDNLKDIVDTYKTDSALGWAGIFWSEAKSKEYSTSIVNLAKEAIKRHPDYFLFSALSDATMGEAMETVIRLAPNYEKTRERLECKVDRVFVPWTNCSYGTARN